MRWARYGSDSNPCSNVYHGKKAFSEPETKAIADFVVEDKQKWLAYFSIHAYSQLWLVPYGFEPGAKPHDYDELMRVAQIGTSAVMAEHDGLRLWEVGNTVNLTYPCSGSSDDWAKAIVGIKYSYSLELFPGSNALTGFVVSEAEIPHSGREVIAALMASIDAMEIPSEDNQPDSFVLADDFDDSELNPDYGYGDEFSLTLNELQIILNKLAIDLRTLMHRVDMVESLCSYEGQLIRDRIDRVEKKNEEAENDIDSLQKNTDLIRKALATTQNKQMTIQKHLFENWLILVLTPKFAPKVVNLDALVNELLKSGINDTDEEILIETVRSLDVEDVVKIEGPSRHLVTVINDTRVKYELQEFAIQLRHLRRHQRSILLGQNAKRMTEMAGFWFEPRHSTEEVAARNSLENYLNDLKIRYGNDLTYSMKGLRLATNRGDFFYDTISRKVLPVRRRRKHKARRLQ